MRTNSRNGNDVPILSHNEVPAAGSVLDELQTCALGDVGTSGEREVAKVRDAAQIHETAVGQLLTPGEDEVNESRASRRARLRQHVHSAVGDARAVAQIEAGDARHVAHDERHRRVRDVTPGEVERLAAAQPADGVVDAGSVIERRRQQVLDARVAHALRPAPTSGRDWRVADTTKSTARRWPASSCRRGRGATAAADDRRATPADVDWCSSSRGRGAAVDAARRRSGAASLCGADSDRWHATDDRPDTTGSTSDTSPCSALDHRVITPGRPSSRGRAPWRVYRRTSCTRVAAVDWQGPGGWRTSDPTYMAVSTAQAELPSPGFHHCPGHPNPHPVVHGPARLQRITCSGALASRTFAGLNRGQTTRPRTTSS